MLNGGRYGMICRCFKACNCTRIGRRRGGHKLSSGLVYSSLSSRTLPILLAFSCLPSVIILYTTIYYCVLLLLTLPRKRKVNRKTIAISRWLQLLPMLNGFSWYLRTPPTFAYFLSVPPILPPPLCVCLMQPLLL